MSTYSAMEFPTTGTYEINFFKAVQKNQADAYTFPEVDSQGKFGVKELIVSKGTVYLVIQNSEKCLLYNMQS